MKDFCEKSGIKMQRFLENAIEHEVKREVTKEELMEDIEAINEYENDKHRTFSDEKTVLKRLGL